MSLRLVFVFETCHCLSKRICEFANCLIQMPVEKKIAVLAGDGIGEEVVAETIKVLFSL